MSDVSPESLTETVNAIYALLSEVKGLLQTQSRAPGHAAPIPVDGAEATDSIQQLRGEFQALRDQLSGIQFSDRFDYIGDSVRRIGLFMEEYAKIQNELAYLPESINAIFAQMRESIEQRMQAQAREALLADYERRLRETIEQGQSRETLLADYERRLRETIEQGQSREILLADYERRLRETIEQGQTRETQLADYDQRLQQAAAQLAEQNKQLQAQDKQLQAAYARLGIFRPRS